MAQKTLIKPRRLVAGKRQRKYPIITEQGKVVGSIPHDEVSHFQISEKVQKSAIDELSEQSAILKEKVAFVEARLDRLRQDFGEIVRLLLDNNQNKSLVRINAILKRYINLSN